MKRLMIAIAAALAPASLAVAQSTAPATTAPAAVTPPPYTPVRWTENYSYLKNPALRSDPFDPIKYIPLGPDGFYLSLGGQLRERYENFDNPNFGALPTDDDGFFLHRGLFHADFQLGPVFRVFGQYKFALEDGTDGGARATDADESDIQQLFADAKIPLGGKDSVTLRFGRQDLIYGAQRLISPLDWTNTRRTFEGGKASIVTGASTTDLFWVKPVIVDKEEPNAGDGNTSFAGVYNTTLLPNVLEGAGTKLEVYGLALNKTKGPASGVQGPVAVDSDTYTVGARFSSAPKPFDFDVEADYQFGQFDNATISAWSLAAEVGYTCTPAPFKPRAFVGFDIASGDDDPTDGDFNRFNQLFPLGHLYFGYIDAIGRQNVIDVHPGIDFTLAEKTSWAQKLTLRAEYHLFWRESTKDGVFNAGGGLLRAAGGSDESYIGSELDLLLTWQIDRHTQAYLGYSYFWAGDFIEDTGPSEDISYVYAALQFTF